MQFKQFISAVAFSTLTLASSISQAATSFYNLNTTTIGAFVLGLQGQFNAAGYTVGLANVEAVYRSYDTGDGDASSGGPNRVADHAEVAGRAANRETGE